MNLIDKLYTEWAWRTKTGTPSMDNVDDKAVLGQLLLELVDTDGEVSKDELIKTIQNGEFTPEQLKTILNRVSSVAYREDIMKHLNSKGKAISAISKYIYNELIDNGDIQNYHALLNKLPNYESLGKSGNLYKIFAGKFSQETLKYLMDKKPSMGNVATGKGEIYLGTLVSDVKTDAPHGDVTGGGKTIEVKNSAARPAGQKVPFSKNANFVFTKYFVEKVNNLLSTPINISSVSGKRVFHRINIVLDYAMNENPELIDKVLEVAEEAINRVFVGVDLSGLQLKNFKEGNSINADGYELEFCKRFVKLYIESEKFDEILFLNDKSGNFIKIPSATIIGLLGKSIKINMKDGHPQWSYVF